MRADRSSPVTAYPARAMSTARVPVPQPRSATLAGAGGRVGRRTADQAARTGGSRSPWSGSSSNVAAAASQSSIALGRARSWSHSRSTAVPSGTALVVGAARRFSAAQGLVARASTRRTSSCLASDATPSSCSDRRAGSVPGSSAAASCQSRVRRRTSPRAGHVDGGEPGGVQPGGHVGPPQAGGHAVVVPVPRLPAGEHDAAARTEHARDLPVGGAGRVGELDRVDDEDAVDGRLAEPGRGERADREAGPAAQAPRRSRSPAARPRPRSRRRPAGRPSWLPPRARNRRGRRRGPAGCSPRRAAAPPSPRPAPASRAGSSRASPVGGPGGAAPARPWPGTPPCRRTSRRSTPRRGRSWARVCRSAPGRGRVGGPAADALGRARAPFG